MNVERQRRSPRLKGYDYSQNGAYFITICTQGRLCLLGDVVDEGIHQNDAGLMAAQTWTSIPERFPKVDLDEYIVMPNHLHGILVLTGDKPSASLSTVIQWFKSITTHEYMRAASEQRWESIPRKLWQRSFYDKIIRNERMLSAVREYIFYNPVHWALDSDNPAQIKPPKTPS